MLKELFSNRLFIGALGFFVLCVVGSLLYMYYDMQRGAAEFAKDAELTKDQEQIKQLTERQKSTTEAPVVEGNPHRGTSTRIAHSILNHMRQGLTRRTQTPVLIRLRTQYRSTTRQP